MELTLRELRAAHDSYHDTGMCYGDSHAAFVAEERRLYELENAICTRCRDWVPIDRNHGGLVIHYDDGGEWCEGVASP